MARPNHNIDFAGPEVILGRALRYSQEGKLAEAIFWAATAAQKAGGAAFFEANALAAGLLTQAGQSLRAAYYWDRIIKSAPQKLQWLEAALRLTCNKPEMEKYARDWLAIFRNVFIATPSLEFMAFLEQMGEAPSGSVGLHRGNAQGWLWLPQGQLPLFSVSGSHRNFTIKLQPRGQAAGHVLYELREALPESDKSWQIHISTPAGQHVCGSPIFCSAAKVANVGGGKDVSAGVSIIIPVYDDAVATLTTLGTVFASLKYNKIKPHIVVAWDNGPDKKLLSQLQRLAKRQKIRLIENPSNMGFLASVNNAMAQAPGRHIILLNADTLVHGNWIDRLCHVADVPDTGTVTALGNEAENMSYPSFRDRGKVKDLKDVALLDNVASQLTAEEALQEITVGVGFCMLITRQTIKKIGGLDGYELFKGYGEEADFCLRAASQGFKNYGAFNVFVGHFGERSFGSSKKALASQNNVAIYERFPHYQKDYELALYHNGARELRRTIALNTLSRLAELPLLEVRPWNARILPPWIRDEQHKPDTRGAVLFLQPSSHVRALLRVWAEVPVMEMDFNMPEEWPKLLKALQELKYRDIRICSASSSIVKLCEDLGLAASDTCSSTLLPLRCWNGEGQRLLVAPPITWHGFKLLKQLALACADRDFYVFHIETLWPDSPKPPNIYEMPLMEAYSSLEAEAFLMVDNFEDVVAWRDWLASHDCPDMPVFQAGVTYD